MTKSRFGMSPLPARFVLQECMFQRMTAMHLILVISAGENITTDRGE